MITVVRVVQVLLLLLLVLLTLSLVIGVATPDTGAVEKVGMLLLIGGCVYVAAKVSALSDWARHRLARR